MQNLEPFIQQMKWAAASAGIAPIAGAAALTVAALLAFITAVPAARRTIAPFPKEPTFRATCPFVTVQPDGHTVKCRQRRIMRAWKIAGSDHATMPPAARTAAWRARCDTLDSISEQTISLRFLSIRLPSVFHTDPPDIPSDLAPPIADLLNRWHRTFGADTTYTNRHWIVAYTSDSGNGAAALDQFSDRIAASLADYNPTAASCGHENSLAELMSAMLAPTAPSWPAIQPGCDLPHLVCSSAYQHHGRSFSFHGHGRELHFIPMGIRALPDTFSENTITALLRIPCPLILNHMIHPIPRAMATLSLARQRKVKQAFSLSGPNSAAVQELSQSIDALEGSHPEIPVANLFNHQFVIMAGATSREHLARNQRLVQRATAPSGTTLVTEGFASKCAYWSMFPTFDTPHRPFRALTPHIATWTLPQSTPSGLASSDWTDRPLATFRTADRSPYHFQWHVSQEDEAVGHCMVIAPTGAGKTTLLLFLTAHTLSIHNSLVWLFDRYNGTEIFVRAAGGDYLTFTGSDPVRMNPFLLPDTEHNREFLKKWVLSLVTDPTPQDKTDITSMVDIAYDYMSRGNRSLAKLYKGALSPDSSARQHLYKWVSRDQYGTLFNADEDTTTEALGSRITAYDCTTAFDDPNLAAPLISYLVHRIRSLSTTTAQPTLIYIDETAPMLRTKHFRDAFISGLREGRKLRQVYVCVFQDPADIATAGISTVVRGQCQTGIFMPNNQASPEAYSQLDLTESEFAFVSGRTHRDGRAALIKRYPTAQSTIIDTDLKPVGNHLRLFSSGQRAVQQFRALQARHGNTAEAIRQYLS